MVLEAKIRSDSSTSAGSPHEPSGKRNPTSTFAGWQSSGLRLEWPERRKLTHLPKVIGSETLVRLSTDPANDLSAAWSPDGRQIAFLRHSGGQQTVLIVPALGGPERVLYSSTEPLRLDTWDRLKGGTLSWSPDGRFLAVSETQTESRESRVMMVSVETGQKEILFSSSAGSVFQYPNLRLSPTAGSSLLQVLPAKRFGHLPVSFFDSGTECLTFTNSPIQGLDWTNDGQAIIFSKRDKTGFHLWRIAISGGGPERLMWIGEGAFAPCFSRWRKSLAYVQNLYDTDIWRFELPPSPNLQETPLVSSTRLDSSPRFSPTVKG